MFVQRSRWMAPLAGYWRRSTGRRSRMRWRSPRLTERKVKHFTILTACWL